MTCLIFSALFVCSKVGVDALSNALKKSIEDQELI